MKEVLPNMRLFLLASEAQGQDWNEKVSRIDEALNLSPYDLAEESVYLVFQKGRCSIGRSVIGPQKGPEIPFELIDWQAKPVERIELKERIWDRLMAEIEEYEHSGDFMLCMRRQLGPKLKLSVEVIFSE